MLPIVIQIDDMRPPGVAPAGQDRVVLAEISRVLDQGNRHFCPANQGVADDARGLVAAIVDQHDLMPALDRQRLEFMNHRTNRLGTVVERNDKAERDGRHDRGRQHVGHPAERPRIKSPVTRP